MVQLNFNASAVKPYENDTIPAGWYNVICDNGESKPTKDGANAYLELRYSVLDGQYAGRKLFSRHNIWHSNPTTVEIAWQEISAIAHAVGVMNVQDHTNLMNIPFKAKVRVRKDKSGEYDDQNTISSYKHASFVTEQDKAPGAPAAQQRTGGFVPPPAGAQQVQNPVGGWNQQPPAQQPQQQQFAPTPVQQYAPPAQQPPAQQMQQPPQQPWDQGQVQQQQPQQPPQQQMIQQQPPAQFQPPVQQVQQQPQFQPPQTQQVQQSPQQHPAQTQTPPWERQG